MSLFTLIELLRTGSLAVGGLFMLAVFVTALYEIVTLRPALTPSNTERKVLILFATLSGIGLFGLCSLLIK